MLQLECRNSTPRIAENKHDSLGNSGSACPAYTDYRTKFVARKILQPLSTYHLKKKKKSLPKEKRYFSSVKISAGSKTYVAP